jgi:hypothetical protein
MLKAAIVVCETIVNHAFGSEQLRSRKIHVSGWSMVLLVGMNVSNASLELSILCADNLCFEIWYWGMSSW